MTFLIMRKTLSFCRRRTQMNDVALRANDVLRNDVTLRVNDVALRANGFNRSFVPLKIITTNFKN